MTVGELIIKLRAIDPKMDVYVGDINDKETLSLGTVRVTDCFDQDLNFVELLS